MLYLAFIAVAFATARFAIPMPGLDLSAASIYKDFAHLFVGGLFGTALTLTACRGPKDHYTIRFWTLAWLLTAVEVAAFFIQR